MNKHFIYNIFSSIPRFETEHLLLRRMKVEDAEDMFEYACSAEVTRYLTWNPHADVPNTREYLTYVQKQYEAGEFYNWALIYKPDMKMIGTCGFTSFDDDNNSAEIGYVVNPAYQDRGLATEAVKEVIAFGFQKLGLNRIEAKYIEGNEASRRVMEKCGMSYEGTHRSALLIKGEYKTISVCALLRDEFLTSHKESASPTFAWDKNGAL